MKAKNYDIIKELMKQRAECQKAIAEIKSTDCLCGIRLVFRNRDYYRCHEEETNNKQNIGLYPLIIENLTKKYTDRIDSIDKELKEL
jgi:hypothetical protein